MMRWVTSCVPKIVGSSILALGLSFGGAVGVARGEASTPPRTGQDGTTKEQKGDLLKNGKFVPPKNAKELELLEKKRGSLDVLPKDLAPRLELQPKHPLTRVSSPPTPAELEAQRASKPVEGRVVEVSDTELMLEREVDAKTADALLHMGFRRIKSMKDVQHRTLLGTRVFAVYEKAALAEAQKLTFSGLAGRNVRLKLERDESGEPRVIGIEMLSADKH